MTAAACAAGGAVGCAAGGAVVVAVGSAEAEAGTGTAVVGTVAVGGRLLAPGCCSCCKSPYTPWRPSPRQNRVVADLSTEWDLAAIHASQNEIGKGGLNLVWSWRLEADLELRCWLWYSWQQAHQGLGHLDLHHSYD